MTKEIIAANFGQGAAKLSEQGPGGLRAILTELQGLKFAVVAGANADTGITLTGAKTEDTLLFVLGLDPDNATPADQVIDWTSAFAITAADTIKAATQATTGYDLVVVWMDKR